MQGSFGLIDPDTPEDAMTRTSYIDGSTMELVFSDEFNTDGRSFYPGGQFLPISRPLFHYSRRAMMQTTLIGKLLIYTTGRLTTWNGALFVILISVS